MACVMRRWMRERKGSAEVQRRGRRSMAFFLDVDGVPPSPPTP